MIPTNRWLAVPGALVFGLLPLFLCVTGAMDINALILTYAVEAGVVVVFADLEASFFESAKVKFGGVAISVIVAGAAGASLSRDVWVVAGVAGVIVVDLGSIAWAARGREVTFTDACGGPRGVAWRMAVVLVSLFALQAADDYADLVDHEWTPTRTDDWWSPVPLLLVKAATAIDLDPMVIPAVILVVFKTVNEVLFETIQILREEQVDREPARP